MCIRDRRVSHDAVRALGLFGLDGVAETVHPVQVNLCPVATCEHEILVAAQVRIGDADDVARRVADVLEAFVVARGGTRERWDDEERLSKERRKKRHERRRNQ